MDLTDHASHLTGGLIVFVVTGLLGLAACLVVFTLLRRRGDRIRSQDPDPRIVSGSAIVAFAGSEHDLLQLLARSVVIMGGQVVSTSDEHGRLVGRTPANLRTWGQELAVSVTPSGDAWKLSIQTWPSRDRQTLDTKAGGRMAIKKFLKVITREPDGVRIESRASDPAPS